MSLCRPSLCIRHVGAPPDVNSSTVQPGQGDVEGCWRIAWTQSLRLNRVHRQQQLNSAPGIVSRPHSEEDGGSAVECKEDGAPYVGPNLSEGSL